MLNLEPIRLRQHLHLQEMVGDIPLLLTALSDALRKGDLEKAFQPPADAWARARTHARIRLEQGFSLADLMREFQLLRGEIWHAFRIELPEMHSGPDDILLLGQEVNYALDALLSVAASAWGEFSARKGELGGKEDRSGR